MPLHTPSDPKILGWERLLQLTSGNRPTSETCRQKTWWRSNWALSLKDGSLGKDTKCAILEKRSTTARITLFSSEGDRPVTKSTEMCDYGSWGSGMRLQETRRSLMWHFCWLQMGQALMYSLASFSSMDHLKYWRRMSQVLWLPGSQNNLEVWAQQRTSDLKAWDVYRWFVRQMLGPGGPSMVAHNVFTWPLLPPGTGETGYLA